MAQENQRLAECVEKQKVTKQRLQKEIAELKQPPAEKPEKLQAKMNVAELEVVKAADPEPSKPLLKFSAAILMTIDKTIPLYLRQSVEAEDESQLAPPTPRIGELLFPSFNALVPTFVEQVVPNLRQLTSAEIEVTVGTLYDMLLFAFNT